MFTRPSLLLPLLLFRAVADPVLTVVDAQDPAGLKFTTSVSNATFPIYLELDTEKLQGVTVGVDFFVAPDSSRIPVAVTMDGKPIPTSGFEITAQQRPRIDIRATFDVAGDYKSHISIVASGKRLKSIPLTISRQRNALTTQIEGINPVPVTRRWYPRTVNAEVRFLVRETSGHGVDLDWPQVIPFAMKEGTNPRQTGGIDMTFDVSGQASGQAFHLGRSAAGKLTVSNLSRPGEYTGKIRLSSADASAPTDADVTIFVKDDWTVAFFFILIGVLSSYLIRHYTKDVRPKLVALRGAEDIRQALEQVQQSAGTMTDVERRVFEGLRSQIAELERDLTRGTSADSGAAVLKELKEKVTFLPDWLTVGAKIHSLPRPSIAATPAAKWEAMADSYFLKRGAAGPPASDLAQIRTDLNQAVKNDLLKRIEAFQTTAKSHADTSTGVAVQIKASVLPLLATASVEATNDKLIEATKDFDSARLLYAHIVADELKRTLAGPAAEGFQPSDWRDLGQLLTPTADRIIEETNPDTAQTRLDPLQRQFLKSVINAVRPALASSLEASKGIGDAADKTTAQTAITDARKALDDGQASPEIGSVEAASAAYQKAVEAVRNVDRMLKPAGATAKSALIASMPTPIFSVPAGAGIQPEKTVAAANIREMSRSERITLQITQLDGWLTAAILLVATVVGLSALWANAPAWGSAKDYITALLWGFGLQQGGGAAVDGLTAVTNKLLN